MAFDVTQRPYQRFRSTWAERTTQIVVWCGSGLSLAAGLPDWRRLRAALEEEVAEKARTLAEPDASKLTKSLEPARREKNFWVAFGRLKKLLGKASYSAAIRKALSPGNNAKIPPVYQDLWKLRPKGILSLNLDRFAARSFSVVSPTLPITECEGKAAGKYAHALKSSAPFVVNLHGVADDESSWVFDNVELKELLENEGYRGFVDAVFRTCTVLFVGTSADDRSVGGLLAELRTSGTDPGQHFWLTARRDAATDNWAEERGIQLIRYDDAAGHDGPIRQFLGDLLAFRPLDPPTSPIVPPGPGIRSRPDPAEIASKAPEDIRTFLSGGANEILTSDPNSGPEYDRFCKMYSRALHNAWYVETEPPNNVLFENRIIEQLGQGAFGTVYGATAPDGSEVAVKLLRQEIRDNAAMLGSFRRGVKAMRILRDRSVQGMVPYLKAYELPPCVVMERVHGADLEKIVEARTLNMWPDGLRVLLDTASIVHAAHSLPERVLHRDLRPANIMLRDYYATPDAWQVVVLDFDLSWHLGATEKSIVDFSAGAALGYLAPEQLAPAPDVSTRSTAVDAYGLAMTGFFVCARQHPRAGDAASPSWADRVRNATAAHPCSTWQAAPGRLARLLIQGTSQSQFRRLDMSQIRGELEQLLEAVQTPAAVRAPEMWAEELIVRAFPDEHIVWSEDAGTMAKISSPTGWTLQVSGDPSRLSVEALFQWVDSGSRDRTRLERLVRELKRKSESTLRQGGWSVLGTGGSAAVFVRASVAVDEIWARRDRLVNALHRQRQILQNSLS